MPFSTGYFKQQTKEYILENYNKNCKILDISAGCGTYSDLLKPEGYENIDGVEVFYDYVTKFNLKEKYKNLYIGDINSLNIDFNQYDLIILGDVLEHTSVFDAQTLLSKINKNVIIGVPFLPSQTTQFDNIHETHQQEDLTFSNFFERYGEYYPLCLRHNYCIFIKEKPEKLTINIEINEHPLPDIFIKEIENKFPEFTMKDIEKASKTQVTKLEKNKVTIVTGLWNMGRGDINESFKRSYSDYLDKMALLLATDVPMYIFIDKADEEFIWKHRKKENTVLNFMSLDDMKEWFEFTDKVNEIRKDEKWLSQASWLRESPQATLEGYNPVVMSKMFMVNNVTIWNPFESEYFFWIDAGIANTVHYGYFTHDKVFNNLPDFIDANNEFVFLTYPYVGGGEIHGFERGAIANYANTDYVKYVCRGGFFGGKKERINEINSHYYRHLKNSLSEGYMGTEESIFSIILYNNPELVTQYLIEDNGLIWPFFEDLKDKNYKKNIISLVNKMDIKNAALYVLTYNSPEQFSKLCQSFEQYDKNFLNKPKKFLIDNSTDSKTYDDYKKLCEKYDFTHLKMKENLGICGGRQYISEHADENNFDYHFFFEDDMFFYLGEDNFCKNGFMRKVDNLYDKVMNIIWNEKFDYLKWNFTEFFGDNSRQWAWHNVPQDIREKFFPERPNKTSDDTNKAPFLKYKNIKSFNGLPYATGEIYYCNWPQVVSREGNKKMFLETKWAYPYEQTWMSYIYQETLKDKIVTAILLATPTEHNRFFHYTPQERKES